MLCSFVVNDRYDFAATVSKQFGPRLQFFFVVADLNIIRCGGNLIEVLSPNW